MLNSVRRLPAPVLLGAALATTAAAAQPRPLTTSLPCASVAALVSARGAVVLGTGPNAYDRYVAHGGLCERGQGSEPAFERAADTAQCLVGYRCRSRLLDGGRGN